MARSTGIVLATGGIVLANEAIFAPTAAGTKPGAIGQAEGQVAGSIININWRVIPATVILAFTLAGVEKIAPGFAVGLAGLALLSVLIVPYGNAQTPVQNIADFVGKGP